MGMVRTSGLILSFRELGLLHSQIKCHIVPTQHLTGLWQLLNQGGSPLTVPMDHIHHKAIVLWGSRHTALIGLSHTVPARIVFTTSANKVGSYF